MDGFPSTGNSPVASVVLVDDHGVVRAGLARMIDDHDDLQIVGQAADARSAVEVVEVKRPDIVVLDITLGSENALEVLPTMLARSPASRVLILSMHDDAGYVQDAFAAGAHGYLLKEAAETDLIDALRSLLRGDVHVHPALGARLARAASAGPDDCLSEREREIARLLALGHTNHDVSGHLFLSVRTVETHRSHVMTKLRLGSRAELVRWALDSGLIGQPSR